MKLRPNLDEGPYLNRIDGSPINTQVRRTSASELTRFAATTASPSLRVGIFNAASFNKIRDNS